MALAVSLSSFGLSKTFLGLVIRYISHYWSYLEHHAHSDLFMAVDVYLLRSIAMQVSLLVRPATLLWHNGDNEMKGVIKSMVGEITDHTNKADAFALLHVPWAVGSSFG